MDNIIKYFFSKTQPNNNNNNKQLVIGFESGRHWWGLGLKLVDANCQLKEKEMVFGIWMVGNAAV